LGGGILWAVGERLSEARATEQRVLSSRDGGCRYPPLTLASESRLRAVQSLLGPGSKPSGA